MLGTRLIWVLPKAWMSKIFFKNQEHVNWRAGRKQRHIQEIPARHKEPCPWQWTTWTKVRNMTMTNIHEMTTNDEHLWTFNICMTCMSDSFHSNLILAVLKFGPSRISCWRVDPVQFHHLANFHWQNKARQTYGHVRGTDQGKNSMTWKFAKHLLCDVPTGSSWDLFASSPEVLICLKYLLAPQLASISQTKTAKTALLFHFNSALNEVNLLDNLDVTSMYYASRRISGPSG